MLGAESLVHVLVEAEAVVTEEVLEALADIDATAVNTLQKEQTECRVNLVVRADSSTAVAAGESVQLSVRPNGMHFFALGGGNTITS
jgi:ABC-type sugar transport system ATPase subunit